MMLYDPFKIINDYYTSTQTESVDSNEKELILNVDLPGVKRDDLSIYTEEQHLILNAKRGLRKIERLYKIPRGYNPDEISATLENGVLHVRIPKADQYNKKRLISVQ